MSKTPIHIAFHDLQYTLQHYPNRIAIIDKDGTTYNYSSFEKQIAGAYHTLSKMGVKKGTKILVAVPMSMQLYAILEALFALGATAIFLDPWMKGKKMGSIIRQVKPELFIVTKKLSRITWLLSATWKLKKWKVTSITPSDQPYSVASIEDEDNALITFTSGTSGKPKGANRTFAFLFAQAETLKPHLTAEKETIDYTNFPIVGLADLAVGNTVAIPQLNLMQIHKATATSILKQLKDQKVKRLIVSPSLLKKALPHLKHTPSLKTVITGGAPISISLVKSALELNTAITFEAIYGSTEAEPICMTTFDEINTQLSEPLKGVYVGTPVPEIHLKIVEARKGSIDAKTFNTSTLSDNKVGEVVVTGAHVNKNYYENPEAFLQNKIVDDAGRIWHRTGDIGYLENNVLYLVGRDHRIMTFKNQKIYPYPIEQFIETKLGISDLGYVQDKNNHFCLYYHAAQEIPEEELIQAIRSVDYPIDTIIFCKKPLPRDARHKSKLQIEKLRG